MPRMIITRGAHVVEDIEIVVGTTPYELMVKHNPETENWATPTVCMVRGDYLMRADWKTFQLDHEDIVVFSELPMGGGGGGGGSNPLQIILSVIIVVIATIVTWGVGTAPTLVGLMGANAAMAVGYAVGAAVMIAGNLLMGSLFPPPTVPSARTPSLTAESASPTYSINPMGNQARMFQPVPELFGLTKVVPDLVVAPWGQYISNEQYLYQVVGMGRGDVAIKKLYFGDSLAWDNGSLIAPYTNIGIQLVSPGQKVTLFPDNVESSMEVSGQELIAPNMSGGWIGPFAANSPGTKTDTILLSFTFPRGIGRFNDNGSLGVHWGGVAFEARQINDEGKPIGSFYQIHQKHYEYATQTPQRITVTCNVSLARWEVRAKKDLDDHTDNRTMQEIRWESMSSMLPGSLSYDQYVIALKIKAENTLSQSAASNLAVVAQRKLPRWNPATRTWSSPVETRSFADAVAWVCKAPWGGRLKDRQIDLEKLYQIGAIIDARGWTFDYWVDGPCTVFDFVCEICSSFLVLPRLAGTVLSFVLESADRPVRAEFTPHNIIRGSFNPSYATYDDNTPDDVVVDYRDETKGYAARSVRAKLPESESLTPANRTPPGIVKRAHAHAIGVALAAYNRYRRITLTFETEGVGRMLMRGDVISVKHPRFGDSCYSVLESWNEAILAFRLKDTLTVPSAVSYLSLTQPSGRPWGPCKVDRIDGNDVYLSPADYAVLLQQTQSNPFRWVTSGVSSVATIAALHSARTFDRRMLVQSVAPQSLFRYRIDCMIDHPDAYKQNIPVPPEDDRGQLPENPSLEAPRNLSGTVSGTADLPIINLVWLSVVRADAYIVEYSVDGISWANMGRVLQTTAAVPVSPGTVRVRVAAVAALQGAYSYWTGNTVLQVPSAVPGIEGDFQDADAYLTWFRAPGAVDHSLKIDTVPAGASPKRHTYLGGTSFVYTMDMAKADGGPWRALSISVAGRNQKGEGNYNTKTVTQAPPETPKNVTVSGSAAILRIGATASSEVSVTGYIAVRLKSAVFASSEDVLEIVSGKGATLTFTGSFANSTQYLAISARDGFYDATQRWQDLNISAIYEVVIPG